MKNKIRLARFCLLLLLALGLAVIVPRTYDAWRAGRDQLEAAQAAGLAGPERTVYVPAPPEAAGGDAPEEPLPEEAAHLLGMNLDALREINGDVVGWIEIPGTELSYPLMQGADNQYYLSHNWKGEPNSGGSVFLECTSSRDLAGFHTIVYAHRMNNDSMFGTLKYYEDREFWAEHPSVYLATEDGVYHYNIFAAQKAGVKGIVYRLDLEENHLEEAFLQACLEGSVIETGIVPEAGERILTLSTCTSGGHAARWVVHGVLAQKYGKESLDTNLQGSRATSVWKGALS